jgi:hypothetical protein
LKEDFRAIAAENHGNALSATDPAAGTQVCYIADEKSALRFFLPTRLLEGRPF